MSAVVHKDRTPELKLSGGFAVRGLQVLRTASECARPRERAPARASERAAWGLFRNACVLVPRKQQAHDSIRHGNRTPSVIGLGFRVSANGTQTPNVPENKHLQTQNPKP